MHSILLVMINNEELHYIKPHITMEELRAQFVPSEETMCKLVRAWHVHEHLHQWEIVDEQEEDKENKCFPI